LAEKPSVARDIARVLGARSQKKGFFEGNGYRITWAIGHLVALAQPHEINPRWKAWKRALLPMIPDTWPLSILKKTTAQFRIVKKLLCDRETDSIICATDAGREGELIFRYIYEKAGCKKTVRRLWISSLTPSAIKKGFENLASGSSYETLASAARGRSQADWLVGMNLSRAYTIMDNTTYSVGRVQTPTLAMIVKRTREIDTFVPEHYRIVAATFVTDQGEYEGVLSDGKKIKRFPLEPAEAESAAERAKVGTAHVASVKKDTKRRKAPLLYDLTELQRDANRLFGFSAKKTLQTAQNLYEKHKLISYPRTDCRYLSSEMAQQIQESVSAIKDRYEGLVAENTMTAPIPSRFVNDAKVTDHHAIIPTPTAARSLSPDSDEGKIYDLVCRRLLAAWHDDHVYSTTTVLTAVSAPDSENPDDIGKDLYKSTGTIVDHPGWRILDRPAKVKKKKEKSDYGQGQTFPPDLTQGQEPLVGDVCIANKQTKPPSHYTDATLLTAMESAGNTLDDKELTDAMRLNGLGTPATRAATIETLLDREYVVRKGKSLVATEKGMHLIDVVHEQVKSPAMTGRWERRLKNIEAGQEHLDSFMRDIESYVRDVVSAVPASNAQPSFTPGTSEYAHNRATFSHQKAQPGGSTPSIENNVSADSKPHAASSHFTTRSPHKTSVTEPHRISLPHNTEPHDANNTVKQIGNSKDLYQILHRVFGFKQFRPYQYNVCEVVAAGQDVLLVMPTGAGKSLCYQLPGIARQGTTLVISPLIALMEDQVGALLQKGFRAARIHSGRSRDESRQACRDYLQGELDFLFIAPERLKVPGFPEFLSRKIPSLIAIDEAHCISQWGHDFRPDYRMLKERLGVLRDAPVVALTATATPEVQQDIIEQLHLTKAKRFIHGFRRDNIAIEVNELAPAFRGAAALNILKDPARRPAIVYAPTRKKAEFIADELSGEFTAAAYHAGMNQEIRERVQKQFLNDEIDVIVATIAFGMGIDKPNVRTVIHAALPSSVEGYYQEIGRAGRDGKHSKAVLLFSRADCRTHQYFLDRDYPEPVVLEQIQKKLTATFQAKQSLLDTVDMEEDLVDTCLEKLWIHGGAVVDPDENVCLGTGQWRKPYLAQRQHKLKQLDLITKFAESSQCRMLRLVSHFGDQEDSGKACGHCDYCAPGQSSAMQSREPDEQECLFLTQILQELEVQNGQSKGKVFRDFFASQLDRRDYETLIKSLQRAQLLTVEEDSFEKDGKVIEFQRLFRTARGFQAGKSKKMIRELVTIPSLGSRKKTGGIKRTAAVYKKRIRKSTQSGKRKTQTHPLSPQIEQELKEWRLQLARSRRIPAFRILTNKTLQNIAAQCPETEDSLLSVNGVGPALLKNHGRKILSICRQVGR